MDRRGSTPEHHDIAACGILPADECFDFNCQKGLAMSSKVYFVKITSTEGSELWVTGGTVDGMPPLVLPSSQQ